MKSSNKQDKKSDPQWISLSGLKARGWTDGNIKNFLGKPDKTVKNPYYSSASPMKLFSVAKVLVIEDSLEFKNWQQKNSLIRQKLSEESKRTMDRRRQALINRLESLEIIIPTLSEEQLKKRAIEAYNNLWSERGKFKTAGLDSPKSFLDRISVNYLRHECTEYETHMEEMLGQIGKNEGYSLLRKKILQAIAIKYPHLAHECFHEQA